MENLVIYLPQAPAPLLITTGVIILAAGIAGWALLLKQRVTRRKKTFVAITAVATIAGLASTATGSLALSTLSTEEYAYKAVIGQEIKNDFKIPICEAERARSPYIRFLVASTTEQGAELAEAQIRRLGAEVRQSWSSGEQHYVSAVAPHRKLRRTVVAVARLPSISSVKGGDERHNANMPMSPGCTSMFQGRILQQASEAPESLDAAAVDRIINDMENKSPQSCCHKEWNTRAARQQSCTNPISQKHARITLPETLQTATQSDADGVTMDEIGNLVITLEPTHEHSNGRRDSRCLIYRADNLQWQHGFPGDPPPQPSETQRTELSPSPVMAAELKRNRLDQYYIAIKHRRHDCGTQGPHEVQRNEEGIDIRLFSIVPTDGTCFEDSNGISETVIPLGNIQAGRVKLNGESWIRDLADQCDKKTYGTCPTWCIKACVSSNCFGTGPCSADCGGPGSCRWQPFPPLTAPKAPQQGTNIP